MNHELFIGLSRKTSYNFFVIFAFFIVWAPNGNDGFHCPLNSLAHINLRHSRTDFSSRINLNNYIRDDASERNLSGSNQAGKSEGKSISRREWFGVGATALISGTVITKSAQAIPLIDERVQNIYDPASSRIKQLEAITTSSGSPKQIAPVNLTKVVMENTINVTINTEKEKLGKVNITLDRQTFTETETRYMPHADWALPILRPKPRVIKTIPNSELLLASLVAGSATEIIRTSLLHPLSTIKVRIQAKNDEDPKSKNKKQKSLQEEEKGVGVIIQPFVDAVKEGNLYAGIVPTLLSTVPASGIYYGIRDITKRMLNEVFTTPSKSDLLVISLFSVLAADIISLIARTPADVLSLRLQAVTAKEDQDEIVGTWLQDSLKALPAIILTDLPFLMSKVLLNNVLTSGSESIGRYELIYISTACACAALTTPFDVVRTRILLDSDYFPKAIDSKNTAGAKKDREELKEKDKVRLGTEEHDTALQKVINATREEVAAWNETGEEVLEQFVNITKESDSGWQNLFAGWVERTAYLGLGRAWLDPIRVIGYLGIRDAVLLEWFD